MSVENSVFLSEQPVTGLPGTERVDIMCTPRTVHTIDRTTALGHCLSDSMASLGIAHAKITDTELLTIGSLEVVNAHLKQFRIDIGRIARAAAAQIGTKKPFDYRYFGGVLDDINQLLPSVLESGQGFIEVIDAVVRPLCNRIPPVPIATVRDKAQMLEAEYVNRLAIFSREPRPYDSARYPHRSLQLNLSRRDIELATALAILDDTSLASQVRAALQWYFELRTQDPELDAKIEQRRRDLK